MLHELTAANAAIRIRAGELKSETLVRACLARIDARERDVGAWEYLDRDRALEQARAADRSEPRGALHGIPIGVKDIIDTVDMPTALGTPIYAARRPHWDAACVAAVRAAGAIVLGKTVTTEFAYFHPGKTRNPLDAMRTPGGSSSGSAAAVADAMVPLAFGTQTAGSVIRPASYCGIYGYKASFGELSLAGVRAFAQSLDTLGFFARSLGDIAMMRSVLLRAPECASIAALPSPPRVGLCRTPQWERAERHVQATVESSAEALRRAGARVVDLDVPPHFSALIDAHKTIMAYEAAQNFVHEAEVHAGALSPSFRALIETGRQTSRGSYANAKQAVANAVIELPMMFTGCDVLVTPAAPGEAPLMSAGTGDPVMSRTWTALGVPALSLPLAKGPQGLPVGIQLIAAPGADDRLLQCAQWMVSVLEK